MSINLRVYDEEVGVLLEAIKEYRENYNSDDEVVRVCVLLVDRIINVEKMIK